MTINFLIPVAGITGGVRAVYSLVNALVSLGHDVRVIYPGKMFPREGLRWRVERPLRRLKYWLLMDLLGQRESDWFPLRAKLLRFPDLAEQYIPPAEVTIATSWDTAVWTAGYHKKGKTFSLIQATAAEARGSVAPEQVYDAWRLPLPKIVVSSFLSHMLTEKTGQRPVGQLTLGVDQYEFFTPEQSRRDGRTVLLLYSPVPEKASEEGIAAFRLAKKHIPDLKLVMFGLTGPPGPSSADETYVGPRIGEGLRELYQSADALLFPSHEEGFGLTPLEAMACGCVVVGTRTGALPDYMKDGKTGKLVSPGDVPALAQALATVMKDSRFRERLSRQSSQSAKRFTWEKSARELVQIMKRYGQRSAFNS